MLGLRAVEMAGYLKWLVAIAIQRGNAALDRTALFNSRDSYGAAVAMSMVNARVAPAVSLDRTLLHAAARARTFLAHRTLNCPDSLYSLLARHIAWL